VKVNIARDHFRLIPRLPDLTTTLAADLVFGTYQERFIAEGANSRFVDVPSIRGRARRLTVEEGRKAIVERPDVNKRRVKDKMTSLVDKMPFAVE